MAQRVLDRLPKVKLTFTNDDSRAAAGADTITPPPSTSTSQESSEVPSKEKKQLATAPATSDSFSKQKLAPSPVLKPVSAVVPVASSTPGHPWGLCFLACSLLTALFASDLYTAKPVGHILRFGEMMRVGDRRQYRYRPTLTPPPDRHDAATHTDESLPVEQVQPAGLAHVLPVQVAGLRAG